MYTKEVRYYGGTNCGKQIVPVDRENKEGKKLGGREPKL